jgi:hypothetical protein
VKLHQRRTGEAEDAFRSALSIEPSNALALQGLAEIVMSRSLLYRPFLSYSLAMERAGIGVQVMVIAGLWIFVGAVSALLRAPELAAWRAAVSYTYLGFCAYTWFARPVSRFILSRSYPWLGNA